MKPKYRPRNDNVLVQVYKIAETDSGVAMPETSYHGQGYRIIAVGPLVEDLEPGDRVMMTGVQKVDWDFLPRSRDLLVIKESNVLLVFEDDEFPSSSREESQT